MNYIRIQEHRDLEQAMLESSLRKIIQSLSEWRSLGTRRGKELGGH
jgi:hypothetical protein